MPTRREFLKQAGAFSVAGALATQDVRARKAVRSAKPTGAHITGLIRRDETILRYPVQGDNFHLSWAADDKQYVSLCDGVGILAEPKVLYNSRMLTISDHVTSAKFADVENYPLLARPMQREDDARYYGFGTLALDGQLYQFLSTFNRPIRQGELDGTNFTEDVLRFNGVKLIYSPDNGRTWRNQNGSIPVVWEDWEHRSRDTMLFFDEDQCAFSLLSVLQMGKNYENNRDGYVYVYSPNGITEGTMNELVLTRVPKARLLDRRAYEFFAGVTANGNAKWSSEMRARKPVHTFPRGWVNSLLHPYAWHPSVVYNAPLDRYLMANWAPGAGPKGEYFGKPSYLGFWVAPRAWGPWTQVHEETAWLPGGETTARAYEPQIAPKWLAPDGKSLWIIWTDFQTKDGGVELSRLAEERKHSGYPLRWSEAYLQRYAAAMRKEAPYYSFNTQRIDLLVK